MQHPRLRLRSRGPQPPFSPGEVGGGRGPPPAQVGAAPGYTPVAAKPRTKATGGQIAIAVLSSVLVFVFGVTALLSAGLFIQKGRDYQRVESDLQQAQQELEQAKEGAK